MGPHDTDAVRTGNEVARRVAAMMSQEPLIRLASFFGIFALMAVWELTAPRRPLTAPRGRRWPVNLSIVVLNTLTVRLLFSTTAVGMAALAAQNQWGVLNVVGWPVLLTVIAALVAMDFVLYLQHVVFHAVPALWRLHMMHHADLDVDVTTGARFHPVEIVLSMLIKLAAVTLIGAPPAAVLIFEVVLNATSMFNHSNVRMPETLDRLLRWIVVTPDMHRIHHSVARDETNSNFGFSLPWWDRLLGTYRPDPAKSQVEMPLGLEQFRDPRELTLAGSLALPFRGGTGPYPLGGRR
ncbi:MAG TPA: sterol desaturase family protein [Nitrospiria bacterium]|nr:sterol desaturase family protein [Nitrospiria bacterium]